MALPNDMNYDNTGLTFSAASTRYGRSVGCVALECQLLIGLRVEGREGGGLMEGWIRIARG